MVNFSILPHCEQRHQPITMAMWNGGHIRLPQQDKESMADKIWLAVSLSTRCCLTNEM